MITNIDNKRKYLMRALQEIRMGTSCIIYTKQCLSCTKQAAPSLESIINTLKELEKEIMENINA